MLVSALTGIVILSCSSTPSGPNGNDSASDDEWTILKPALGSLYSVWGSSAQDVFAVGKYGTILHYDGLSWTPQKSGTTSDIYAVWGASGENVFALGPSGVVLRYDGEAWRAESCVDCGGYSQLWGSSGTDVYAAGSRFFYPPSLNPLHFDGSAWAPTDLSHIDPNLPDLGSNPVPAVAGIAADDVFIVGSDNTFVHYDGENWTPCAIPGYDLALLNGMWGSAESGVFLQGTIMEGGFLEFVALHYDGTGWEEVGEGLPLHPVALWGLDRENLFIAGDYEGTSVIRQCGGQEWNLPWRPGGSSLYDIWGASSNSVIAVGQMGTLLRYDGTEWTDDNPWPMGDLFGVWQSADGNLFCVGSTGGVLRYDGSSWQVEAEQIDATLYGIWGDRSTSEIFAVGEEGTIVYHDGISWSVVDAGASEDTDLLDIWGSGSQDVWAVGADWLHHKGIVLHFDGSEWEIVSDDLPTPLKGVWGYSDSDVYAVGRRAGVSAPGTIMHFDGLAWSLVVSSEIPAIDFASVSGYPGGDVFVVGSGGEVLRYDGIGWSELEMGITFSPLDIYCVSSNDVVAVGYYGVICRYSGTSWTREESGAPGELNAVWANESGETYVVGKGGIVLRHTR